MRQGESAFQPEFRAPENRFPWAIYGEPGDLVPVAGINCDGGPFFAAPFLFGESNQFLVFKILCLLLILQFTTVMWQCVTVPTKTPSSRRRFFRQTGREWIGSGGLTGFSIAQISEDRSSGVSRLYVLAAAYDSCFKFFVLPPEVLSETDKKIQAIHGNIHKAQKMLDTRKSAEDIAYYRSRINDLESTIKDLQHEKMIVLQRESPREDYLRK